MTDYPELYRRLAQEILKHEGKIGRDTQAFVEQLLIKLRTEGWRIGPETDAVLTEHLQQMQTALQTGIAVSAQVATGLPLASEVVRKLTEQAFVERWPDGLTLSNRVWKWQNETRNGVQKVLQDGIRQGAATNRLVMAMQREIERTTGGQRFKVVEAHVDDWVTELYQSAEALIHDPTAKQQWQQTAGQVREYIESLKTTGSRNAAERVFDQISKAVANGNEVLLEKAAKWWLYDRQLYALKRIARTEMATALHRGVIASTLDDETIIGYQWRLSASHPVTDICDYYADIDMGLGKGVWTKEAVPKHKAHPHCMCLIIPRVTPIQQKGASNYAKFLQRLPEEKRKELLPDWLRNFNELGMAMAKMVRPDGLGPVTREMMKARMGADKFKAASALSKSLVEKQWPSLKLKLKMPQTRDTLASLRNQSSIPEVAAFLSKLDNNGYQVNSDVWHYFRYKYHFGDSALKPKTLDARFDAVLKDPDAEVHRPDKRLVVVSKKNGRMSYVHEDGKRISVYAYTDVDLAALGAPLWLMKDLIT